VVKNEVEAASASDAAERMHDLIDSGRGMFKLANTGPSVAGIGTVLKSIQGMNDLANIQNVFTYDGALKGSLPFYHFIVPPARMPERFAATHQEAFQEWLEATAATRDGRSVLEGAGAPEERALVLRLLSELFAASIAERRAPANH
jgi:hypothetical protein